MPLNRATFNHKVPLNRATFKIGFNAIDPFDPVPLYPIHVHPGLLEPTPTDIHPAHPLLGPSMEVASVMISEILATLRPQSPAHSSLSISLVISSLQPHQQIALDWEDAQLVALHACQVHIPHPE